jgi:hypothetical protein
LLRPFNDGPIQDASLDFLNAAFLLNGIGEAIDGIVSALGFSEAAAETAVESSTTTVLGSGRDVAAFAGQPGFNVLNMDGIAESEWARTNAEWLNAAIQRGDNIWLVTDPAAHTALMNSLGLTSYYLDLELPMLEEYNADAAFMWH